MSKTPQTLGKEPTRAILGKRATIEFLHSGFRCQGTNFSISGRGSRESLDITTFGSPEPAGDNEYGGAEKIPDAVAEAGSLSLTLIRHPDSVPPFNGDPEPIVITLPPVKGQKRGQRYTGVGFLMEDGEEIPVKGVVTQTAEIQKSGVWKIEPAVAA